MKSFKSLVSEVSQPKPEEEKRFKDQHKVDIAPHPTATEFQHKGTVKPKAKRKADQEGDSNYDAAYGVNEEAEELDEISRDTARSYIRKAAVSGDRKKGIEMAGKKAYSIPSEPKVRATESVDLEEDIAKMSHGRLKFHMNTGTPHGSYSKDEMKSERDRRLKGGDGEAYRKAKAGLSEAEELDEISKKTLGSYVKKASYDSASNAAKYGAGETDKKGGSAFVKAHQRLRGIAKATDRLTKEEVEQLDELSPNTLHSYIKKAAGNMAGNAAVAAAQASSSMKKSSPDVKRKIKNRMTGITGASGRLADKANMAENWQEEIPMMMRQLEFIAYAAEEIMDYVETAGDPEEWFQNKISGIHQSMLSMYAYAQGGRRAGYGFDESVEEELKGGQKKLDHNKNGKLDAHDFKLMRSKKMKEDLDEAVDYDKMTTAELKAAANAAIKSGDRNAVKAITAAANKRIANKGGTPVTKLTTDPKKLDALKKQLHGIKKEEVELDEAKDDVDAKWLVTWRKEQSAGKYMDASAFFPTEREARMYKGRLKHTSGVLRNSPEMKKIKQTEADKRALAKESFEIDEAAPKMKPDFLKTQREKDRAHDAAMGRTPTGRKKPERQMTSTQRSLASMRKEEAELDEATPTKKAITRALQGVRAQPKEKVSVKKAPWEKNEEVDIGESVQILDEAFKQGVVKLKDGGSVVLKKEDADLLNQMFKDLSSTNRKKMQEVAMKDKSGFEEILGFAREAL